MTRRQEILQAASKLFSEQGFDTVSIDDIGKAAGVSGPALYRHFAGRTAILQGVCDLTIERLLELIGDVPGTHAEALFSLVRGQARLVIRHPELVCAFEIQRALPAEVRRRFHRRQRDHARRWVAAIQALQPGRDEKDILVAVYAAIGLIISSARWPREVRHQNDIERVLIAKSYAVLEISPSQER